MKSWTWKQWTAFGVVIALIIAILVLHFVQPVVSYAFVEFACVGTGAIGAVAGYLFGKSKSESKQ